MKKSTGLELFVNIEQSLSSRSRGIEGLDQTIGIGMGQVDNEDHRSLQSLEHTNGGMLNALF